MFFLLEPMLCVGVPPSLLSGLGSSNQWKGRSHTLLGVWPLTGISIQHNDLTHILFSHELVFIVYSKVTMDADKLISCGNNVIGPKETTVKCRLCGDVQHYYRVAAKRAKPLSQCLVNFGFNSDAGYPY